MQDVFWLGRSRSGKSLVSEVIANRFGLDVYHVDEAFEVARDASVRLVIRLWRNGGNLPEISVQLSC